MWTRLRVTGGSTACRAVALAACLIATPALGQLTPDPYNIVGEYNSQYEPFMYAREPGADSLIPNQNRLTNRPSYYRAANRFQSYLDGTESLDGSINSGDSFRRSGAGSPYFQAYRRYDEGFGRVYRPNAKADEQFYSELDQRTQKYFEAREEKDPKKRAQLLREYNLEKLRAARSLSSVRGMPDRPRDDARTTPPSSRFDLDVPFDTPGRPSAGAAPNPRSAGARSTEDFLPSLTPPRSSTTAPAPRAPGASRLSAPPPLSRAGSGVAPATRSGISRPSSPLDSPSTALERNRRFEAGEARPPSSTGAPPPPR